MLSLLWYEIRSRTSAILGWGIGLGLFGAMYTWFYPQVAEQMAGLADLAFYRLLGVQLLSFEGYLTSTVVNFLGIALGVYALMAGTSTLAGEEENGTLELLVTSRLPRWQVVSAKALALAVVMLSILIIGGAGIVLAFNAIAGQVDSDVTALDVFTAFVSAWPLMVTLLALALFLGAYLPSRRSALMVGMAIFIASFLGENVAEMLTSLEWVAPFSIFSYYDTSAEIFSEGPDPRDTAVLAGLGAAFFALALLSFERRDLTVGAWPWQRARQRPEPG